MPLDLLAILSIVLLIAGYALWRGDGPERIAAGMIMADTLFDIALVARASANPFEAVLIQLLLWDCALLFVAFGMAFRANRNWPIVFASAQLTIVLGHLAAGTASDMGMQRAYWAMTQLPILLQLAALGLGTVFHIRRTRIHGPYRNWRYDSDGASFTAIRNRFRKGRLD